MKKNVIHALIAHLNSLFLPKNKKASEISEAFLSSFIRIV